MKRWQAVLPLVGLGVIAVVAYGLLSGRDPGPASFISPARPAPRFEAPDLQGGQVKLDDFNGRPVLVNFWATWCGPCKLEHPLLVRLREEGVEIVGILYRDPNGIEEAKRILTTDGDPYVRVALDPVGDLALDFGLSGVPETFLVDANGQIVKTKRNYLVEADVPAFLEAYRAEAAKAGGGG